MDAVGVEAWGRGEAGGDVVGVEEPDVEVGRGVVEVRVESVQVADEVAGGGDVLFDKVGGFVGVGLGGGLVEGLVSLDGGVAYSGEDALAVGFSFQQLDFGRVAEESPVGHGDKGPLAVLGAVAGPRARVLEDQCVGVLEALEDGAVRGQVGGVGVQAVGAEGKLPVELLGPGIVKVPVSRQYLKSAGLNKDYSRLCRIVRAASDTASEKFVPLGPSVRQRHEHHGSATGRLARDGDLLRVPAKQADVLLHPLQREPHVVQRRVEGAVLGDFGRGQEPKRTQAVLDLDRDHAVVDRLGNVSVIERVGRAEAISTAIWES